MVVCFGDDEELYHHYPDIGQLTSILTDLMPCNCCFALKSSAPELKLGPGRARTECWARGVLPKDFPRARAAVIR